MKLLLLLKWKQTIVAECKYARSSQQFWCYWHGIEIKVFQSTVFYNRVISVARSFWITLSFSCSNTVTDKSLLEVLLTNWFSDGRELNLAKTTAGDYVTKVTLVNCFGTERERILSDHKLKQFPRLCVNFPLKRLTQTGISMDLTLKLKVKTI